MTNIVHYIGNRGQFDRAFKHYAWAWSWLEYGSLGGFGFVWFVWMKRMGENTNGGEGLRNHPRVKYSDETRRLIQMMMRESGLTSFQQRQINSQLKKGGALPLVCNPTSSAPPCQPQPLVSVSKGPALSARPQRRSAEECRAGDNYTRETYRPSATRDLEKEKHRLQSILATGQEERQPSLSHQQPTERGEGRETDRFQEVLDEIEERRQFLEEMNALGRGQHYQHIINSQISQKIRELELIDRRRGEELRTQMMKESEKDK